MEGSKQQDRQPYHVLITHRYAWPDNLSLYPAMLKDIAEWHVAQGHKTTIYTAHATSDLAAEQRRQWAENLGVILVQTSLPLDRGKSALGRLGSMLSYASGMWKAIRTEKPDLVIYGSCPPVLPGLVARAATWGRNTKRLYYVQDITPEMIASRGGVLRSMLAAILRRIDGRSVAAADATVTLSDEMRETLLRRPKAKGQVHVIPNYAIEQPETQAQVVSRRRPLLIFAGNQGTVQNLDHFLATIEIANREIEFNVELLGAGSETERLKQIVADRGFPNVRFCGVVPRDEAQQRIASADIGVVAAAPGLYQVAYPSKANSYLLAGLPVLVFADEHESVSQWLRTHRFGESASPTDPAAAAKKLCRLVERVRKKDLPRRELASRAADILSHRRHHAAYQAVIDNLLPPAKEHRMNYANDRVRFDRDRFDFAGLVLDAINKQLAEDGRERLKQLSDIHTVVGIEGRLEEYRQLLFTLFRTPAFQSVYRAFGAMLIDQHFTPEAIIQKTPTVRIHLNGGKSVSFHSDAWYGHGHKVCSFWLPLTPVSRTNSLQMARSIDQSREFLAGIEDAQLDLDEINELASAMCDPVEADFGDLIVFNADMVHGTVDNTTGWSRVSFDFRIAESVHEIGTKPANNFYTRAELDLPANEENPATPLKTRPKRAAYMYSGICRGVSAKSQLVFLNEYARMQGIDIVGSESEIVTFSYCPVLQKYARNPPKGINTVLLFGLDLMPNDPTIRQRIYDSALSSGVELVFAAEDITVRDQAGVDKAEELIRRHRPAKSQQLAKVA